MRDEPQMTSAEHTSQWLSDRAILETGLRGADIEPSLYEAVDGDLMYTFNLV